MLARRVITSVVAILILVLPSMAQRRSTITIEGKCTTLGARPYANTMMYHLTVESMGRSYVGTVLQSRAATVFGVPMRSVEDFMHLPIERIKLTLRNVKCGGGRCEGEITKAVLINFDVASFRPIVVHAAPVVPKVESLNEQALRQADLFWKTRLIQCGRSYYLQPNVAVIQELKDYPSFVFKGEPQIPKQLSRADQLMALIRYQLSGRV
jgi:hypothetical protein